MSKRRKQKQNENETNMIGQCKSIVANSSQISTPDNTCNCKMLKQHLTLKPSFRDLIYEIPNFLTEDECNDWISYSNTRGFEIAVQKASAGFAHRDNDRIQFDDPYVASLIFQRFQKCIPPLDGRVPIGCSSNIRIYRYREGQRFGKHIDDSHYDTATNTWTIFTLLLYLNTVECGGETVFYSGVRDSEQVVSIKPVQGLAVLHGHGDRCLTHEGKAVKAGVKYVLRTDVLGQ